MKSLIRHPGGESIRQVQEVEQVLRRTQQEWGPSNDRSASEVEGSGSTRRVDGDRNRCRGNARSKKTLRRKREVTPQPGMMCESKQRTRKEVCYTEPKSGEESGDDDLPGGDGVSQNADATRLISSSPLEGEVRPPGAAAVDPGVSSGPKPVIIEDKRFPSLIR